MCNYRRQVYVLLIIIFTGLLITSCSKDLKGALESENRCGDGVCDGPENETNCQEDCNENGGVFNSKDMDSSDEPKSSIGMKDFHIMMTIVFESDISKIPGYDGSPYSEPVGYGLVDMQVTFPENGGPATSQEGTITLVNYEEKGPYCTLETPENMIGTQSEISWNQIYWEPNERMNFESEVNFNNPEFTITANCPPLSAPVIEYPIFKLAGIFNEELNTLSIDLKSPSNYFENLHWGMHETMQTNIDVVIEE